MNFKEWKLWVSTLTWERKWFVYLVLLRPVIDVFYALQNISPFLSPLFIVGGLTPVLVYASIQSGRMGDYRRVFQDNCFMVLSIILLLNFILIGFRWVYFPLFHVGIKSMIVPLVYFYLRRFIRSEQDVVGVFATFLFSTLFPLAQLVYENVFGQLSPGQMARGELRFEGLYADVLSYSTYINFSFLCTAFFFMLAERNPAKKKKATMWFVGIFFVCLVAMLSIKHAASWGVFLALILLIMFYSLNPRSLITAVVAVLVVGGGLFFARESIQQNVENAFGTDIAVFSGEIDKERGLHGRMTIWTKYYERWQRSSILAKMFGSGFWGDSNPLIGRLDTGMALVMLSGGMHSDYVRLFYGCGIVGLVCYILFLLSVLATSFRTERTFKFIIIGCVGSMMLYSISTTPLIYASASYFPAAIFAYAALVQERRKFGQHGGMPGMWGPGPRR